MRVLDQKVVDEHDPFTRVEETCRRPVGGGFLNNRALLEDLLFIGSELLRAAIDIPLREELDPELDVTRLLV